MLLPACTIWLAGRVTWFGTNFSCIAACDGETYRSFLAWGVLFAVYFGIVLERTASILPRKGRKSVIFLLELALICMAVGLPLPYWPERKPSWAWAHTLLTCLSCVWLMAAMLLLVLYFRRRGAAKLLWDWWAVVWGCGVLFVLDGIINTALEVYFTLTTARLAQSRGCVRVRAVMDSQ